MASTAAADGVDGAADWWVAMAEDISAHLSTPFTRERFDREVAEAMAEFEQWDAEDPPEG